jgi:uncharacterized protein (PEP-CTERM system associated)
MRAKVMTAGEVSPNPRASVRLHTLALAPVLVVARICVAAAFPLLDAATEGQVPRGTELAAPDAQDLRHQLQIINGLGSPTGGGWTFVPRIDLQEMLTDNVLQQSKPRQFDFVTYISPGFSLAGDLPRLRMTFNYAPTLAMYGRTGSLNALTQQLNGLALVTVVPELAYVDVRAVAGVHNQFGGLGGLGSVGAPAGGATALQATPALAGNDQGLTRNNETQVASFGVSPYLVHRFGDWGVGRLGYSLDVTRSNALSGFASSPFPTGNSNGQTLVTNEQTGHFATGDILDYFQNNIDVDLTQTQSTTDSGFVNGVTGVPTPATVHQTSSREIFTDQVDYVVNRTVTLFVSGGHENIVYSGVGFAPIDDITWSFGTTVTPNPDSSLTLSYGHLNGFNSLSAYGHYALTARTSVNVSYGTGLGTQLETVQNQLNLATTNSNGALVNGQTGGQLFGATNALAVQDGVFRTETLSVGTETLLERDIVSLNLTLAKQTLTGTGAALGAALGGAGTTTTSKTASATWLHQLRPDVIMSAAAAYSLLDQGATTGVNPGSQRSFAGNLALQWQISDTVSTSLRYSFLERQSAVNTFNTYQNLLILGISKAF